MAMSGRSCASALPWELANRLCDSCFADGGCGQSVLVFGDAHPGCTDQGALTFAIGVAYSSTRVCRLAAGNDYRVWFR
jgi:hypothetical protein